MANACSAGTIRSSTGPRFWEPGRKRWQSSHQPTGFDSPARTGVWAGQFWGVVRHSGQTSLNLPCAGQVAAYQTVALRLTIASWSA
jgi:hypothetical protein